MTDGTMTTNKNTGEHQARHSVRSADPDVLRSVINQSRGAALTVRRITTAELRALKVTQRKENHCAVAFTRAISAFVGNLFSGIGALFSQSTKKMTQCDIYGHERASGSWVGQYPTCMHCNIKITSPDMLRTATSRI